MRRSTIPWSSARATSGDPARDAAGAPMLSCGRSGTEQAHALRQALRRQSSAWSLDEQHQQRASIVDCAPQPCPGRGVRPGRAADFARTAEPEGQRASVGSSTPAGSTRLLVGFSRLFGSCLDGIEDGIPVRWRCASLRAFRDIHQGFNDFRLPLGFEWAGLRRCLKPSPTVSTKLRAVHLAGRERCWAPDPAIARCAACRPGFG